MQEQSKQNRKLCVRTSCNPNESRAAMCSLSPSPSEDCLQFHCQVRVCVLFVWLCRSKCLWLHRSEFLRTGWGPQCAAFPCYICKGRSYTYFLLQIKENMLMLSLLEFCSSQSCLSVYNTIVGRQCFVAITWSCSINTINKEYIF